MWAGFLTKYISDTQVETYSVVSTYSIGIHLVFRSTATSHHRLQHSHPALLVREARSHEVEGLAWPAGSVGMRLQL